ncbi:MAG: site-specific integrase [Candidatus Omnitrophica bacterium]|nr:site-specific integrase [Candidatus Omnitrophota bacterium]
MGVILKRDNWYVDYYFNGRRKREKIGTSKKLAEIVLKKRKVAIAEGKFLDIKKEQKVRFDEFADEYLVVHCKSNNKSWFKSDYFNLKNLKAYFGNKYLHEITPKDIEQYKAERIKEVKKQKTEDKEEQFISHATVNRALNCLSSLYNRAIEWGKATDNPMSKVKLFKVPDKRVRFLEKEEIDKLLSHCCEHLKPIVIVALHTGMRKGEILGLKWHDIDIKRNIIHLYDTKNGEKREVPMNEVVQKTVIGVLKNPESQYVFCNKDNKPYGNVRKSFFTALKKAGIINFRFHDLRHTFASQLVMSGVDLNTVRELLGHKSIEMTLRYSHLSPDHKKRAVDVLGKRMDTLWTLGDNNKKLEETSIPELLENKVVV